MTSALFTVVSDSEEHANELLFEPMFFGVITLVVMMGLLALLWGFRNTLALDPVAHGHHATSGSDAGAGSPDSGRGSSR